MSFLDLKKPENVFDFGVEVNTKINEFISLKKQYNLAQFNKRTADEFKCSIQQMEATYKDLNLMRFKTLEDDVNKKFNEASKSFDDLETKLKEKEKELCTACKQRFCGCILKDEDERIMIPSDFCIDNNLYLCMLFYEYKDGAPMTTLVKVKMSIRILDDQYENHEFEEIDEKAFNKMIDDKVSRFRMSIARALNQSKEDAND